MNNCRIYFDGFVKKSLKIRTIIQGERWFIVSDYEVKFEEIMKDILSSCIWQVELKSNVVNKI